MPPTRLAPTGASSAPSSRGPGLKDDGVSRCGCQARRPLSEPSLSEHSFQLLACRPHRVAPFHGASCNDDAEFLSAGGGSHAAERPLFLGTLRKVSATQQLRQLSWVTTDMLSGCTRCPRP